MVNVKYFLFFSAIILFVLVFYRWLMRYLRRNDINIKFAFLFPFDKPYFSHRDNIKIDVAITGMVRAEIISTSSGEVVSVLFEELLDPGIQTKEIDFSPVADGDYIFKIIFPDQTITRFIRIQKNV